MSQDRNVVDINLGGKKKNLLSDRDKIISAYHALSIKDFAGGMKLLASVDKGYYLIQFHKDIARSLLCWATLKSIHDSNKAEAMRKESEFYLIVYRLTKIISSNKLIFPKSGNFTELINTLFSDFQL